MSTTAPATPAAPPPKPKRKPPIPLLILLVLGTGGYFIWRTFFRPVPVPESIVALSGRIEGDDSAIASKTAGRLLEIKVREGDVVQAGSVIATLDDQQIRAREEQAKASLIATEARVTAARSQIAILQDQLTQGQLQRDQSKVDAEGRVRQAESDLAAAEADLTQQEASLTIANFDRDAYSKLAKTGAVSERQGKQSESTAAQQAAAVNAARKRVDAARGSVTTARANLSNPGIRESQISGVRSQIAQQQAEIATAIANTETAKYQLQEAQANRNDLTVVAPFTGTVVTRAAEPGEVVAAGTAIVTLLDLSRVYLRGFVPEGQIGKVKLGQAARVYLDSRPSQPVDAEVLRIDPAATFTPENTYFRDDRVKQVVGLKLRLKGSFGFAKPGMPADGEILVQGSTWPEYKHK